MTKEEFEARCTRYRTAKEAIEQILARTGLEFGASTDDVWLVDKDEVGYTGYHFTVPCRKEQS